MGVPRMNHVDATVIRRVRTKGSSGWSLFLIPKRYWLLAILASLAIVSMTLVVVGKTPSRYRTNANLLVFLSDDYASRSVVGTNNNSFQSSMDRDAYMSAEVAILTSGIVIDEAINSIGVERLYPQLSNGPGLLRSAFASVFNAISGYSADGNRERQQSASARRAVWQSLHVDSGRSGNVITISYENSDRDLAAEFVAKLIDFYFVRRSFLFSDRQAVLLAQQAEAEGAELQKVRTALSSFRTRSGISDFPLQRELLLRQISDLERDLQVTEVGATETEARRATVSEQLNLLPADSVRRTNGAEVIVRRGENADNLQQELNRLEQALSSARARTAGLKTHMAVLRQDLRALNSQEGELDDLKLRQDVKERQYEQILQTLGERKSTEAVAQARQSNVKLMDKPEVPSRPTSHRTVIAATGFLLAFFTAVAILILGWLVCVRQVKMTFLWQPESGTAHDNKSFRPGNVA